MITLLSILDGVFATGIPSNAAWELIKHVWSRVTEKSWDDLYYAAFERAIDELRPQLRRYSGGEILISREELARVLHHKLSFAIDIAP